MVLSYKVMRLLTNALPHLYATTTVRYLSLSEGII